jgi:hypothetical protein
MRIPTGPLVSVARPMPAKNSRIQYPPSRRCRNHPYAESVVRNASGTSRTPILDSKTNRISEPRITAARWPTRSRNHSLASADVMNRVPSMATRVTIRPDEKPSPRDCSAAASQKQSGGFSA